MHRRKTKFTTLAAKQYFNDVRITRGVRDMIFKTFPHLYDCTFCCRLFVHIAYTQQVDQYYKIIVPRIMLEAYTTDMWITKETDDFNFRAHRMLRHFKENVFNITWTHWDWSAGKCRRLDRIDIPWDIKELIMFDVQGIFQKDGYGTLVEREQVYFVSGKLVTSRTQKEQREAEQEAADAMTNAIIDTVVWPDEEAEKTRAILQYLHSLSVQSTHIMRNHFQEALYVAEHLTLPDQYKYYQLCLLYRWLQQTNSVYTNSSEVTTRIFPFNASIALMHRKIRRVLMQDQVELDLKSAQLAIISKVWDVPELKAFLKTRKSFWKYAAEHMRITLTDEHKDVLKDAVYCFCFGGGKAELKKILIFMDTELTDGAVEQFLNIPLIKLVIKARNRHLKQIIEDKKVTLANGVIVAMRKRTSTKKAIKPLSLLAGEIQSYERELLWPCFDCAVRYGDMEHGFMITLYQYDGLTIKAKKEEYKNEWITTLQQLVAEKAKELDIPTALEVTYEPKQKAKRIVEPVLCTI